MKIGISKVDTSKWGVYVMTTADRDIVYELTGEARYTSFLRWAKREFIPLFKEI